MTGRRGRPPKAVLYQGDSRRMSGIESGSVDLVVTSPPYWQIKDYGCPGQIGAGEGLHEYLRSLALVWQECFRALRPGGRLCVNIGDQFARASRYGRYRVIPLHAEVVCQACAIGFDFMGSIIWQKKTTMNTSGGAVVMGSFPYPPNGIVELDYEHIHIFKKPGPPKKVARTVRDASAMTKEEWKSFFLGHWSIGGARRQGHEAPFPVDIPHRLIRMFSFVGDTILDPFIGTGTTARAALALGRNAIGYEINPAYIEPAALSVGAPVERAWSPRVPDLKPVEQPAGRDGARDAPELHKVVSVHPDCTLELDPGERVSFLGLRLLRPPEVLAYLEERILRRMVFLRDAAPGPGGTVAANLFLKNRISVNGHLVKSGLAQKAPQARG